MKVIILSLLILQGLIPSLSSQSVKVMYLQYEKENNSIGDQYKDLPESVKEQIVKNSSIKYKDYFELIYCNGSSHYRYIERKFEDKNLSFYPKSFILDHYDNISSDETVLIANWIPDDYMVVRDKNEKKATFENQVKNIAGYKCKKATIEFMQDKFATVWYTLDIPISAGPSWFNVCPGLVLRVEINDKMITEAYNIEFISDCNKKILPFPNRKNKVTYKQFKNGIGMEWISKFGD